MSHYQTIVSLCKSDNLKHFILSNASSLENYFVLRGNFIRSLAVMSTSHWVLGVGDRHLSNTLIDTKTFELVGIDFGHAFGTATRDLLIPELLPFRLTPQLKAVLEPIGVDGLLERSMTHSMHCFRNERKMLKSCMDLFVRDPTLEWLKSIKTVNKLWAPETRVEIAYRKLMGVNPAKITTEELSLNTISRQGLSEGYEKLLKNANYYGTEEDLTVETQVRKLIEQACDDALLSVTWFYWFPFL